MKLYIDCEFNGHGGKLISMALVPGAGAGAEWYECVEIASDTVLPWVAANIIPVLCQSPISNARFHRDLSDFLTNYDGCEIIADHPADFMHLCRMMDNISAENDFVPPIACTMTLFRRTEHLVSKVPHNALSDARALRDLHMAQS